MSDKEDELYEEGYQDGLINEACIIDLAWTTQERVNYEDGYELGQYDYNQELEIKKERSEKV